MSAQITGIEITGSLNTTKQKRAEARGKSSLRIERISTCSEVEILSVGSCIDQQTGWASDAPTVGCAAGDGREVNRDTGPLGYGWDLRTRGMNTVYRSLGYGYQ